MSNGEVNYKDTLTITSTDFPQKAKLSENEPARLKHWEEIGLERLIHEKGLSREKYVLHDGPPYANGDIHLGTSLNKILKDVIVRYKTMRGFHAHYVPGFDCHGLPIEQKVIEKLGKDRAQASPIEIRRACHEFATRYIGLQTEQFKRLGVGGQWDKPYLTLNPQYEVGILTALKAMVGNGYVYKGFKPVYWDWVFETALAEAEIEYEEHTSPSIYVRFPVLGEFKGQSDATIVIWTTTPWTLPGNLAVSVHPDFVYVLARIGDEKVIVAQELLASYVKEAQQGEPEILATLQGRELEGLKCSHPLLDKESVVILGTHVTLEQGTGCVHTAPAHGVDDFAVGARYNLPVFLPVDEKGLFNDLYPPMKGQLVWKANPAIVDLLREKGLLVHAGTITHQYPYSWRSHKPVLVRATNQWFMDLAHKDIRAKCVKAIEDVRWIPAWGHDRFQNMMQGRPDWCLSRQRSWGVPIPSLYSVKAKQSILCVEVIEQFARLVAEHGTDCWFTMPVEAFIPEGFKCPVSGGTEFEKEYDILDVWFDSGSSHISVLEADLTNLASPADVYFEGSDQHRGWFMASMLTSMAARDRAPYRTVITHGWMLDSKGETMHKSKGNAISPLKVIDDMGADVLRLWVISEDYRNDVIASDSIFKQMMEAYRRIRNTMRFMLGNLSDFNPDTDTMAVAERTELDRWALGATAELIDRITQAYEEFEFHRIYHIVHQFCVVTMSALYLDILKDRLYCSAPGDAVRRSAQSTVYEIFRSLTGILAPVLPFTCDEAYQYGHPRFASIHLEDFPKVPDSWRDAALQEKWNRFVEIREVVMRPLEEARRLKEIGKSLDAAVVLKPKSRELAAFIEPNLDLLRDFFIVSQCSLDPSVATDIPAQPLAENLAVEVGRASGEKCARCWTFSPEVGACQEHPSLCRRCADVVRRIK